MAKRGRPPKIKEVDINENDIEIEEQLVEEENTEPTNEQMAETTPVEEKIVKSSDSDLVGKGTHSDYNPFSESVVERDYSTPQLASGVVDDISEPQFIPPSYEDIVNENNNEGLETEEMEDTGNPFDNPNPALNDLDNKDKKIACQSLVDTFLDGYEQLHKYAQYVVKVDEDELLARHQAGKIDLNETIPVDEKGNEMSVSEFVGQYNEQSVEALQYDKEFGFKVRPAMVRVFMKKGWGMSDEQFLMYHFGKDIAIKVGIMFQLKKTINTTLETLEKQHKRNKEDGLANENPTDFNIEEEEEDLEGLEEENFEDFDMPIEEEVENAEVIDEPLQPLTPLTPEEDFEDNTKNYNQNLDINMPEKKSATILPKDVISDYRSINKKGKKRKGNKNND
tara:strand:+ start:2063 stop:3244 length:1182 start_codon:yes stop_codon:yes gene_type:complete